MAPSKDAGEEIGMRRRRLRYRAWHRGTRELDLMLGPFADSAVASMDAGQVAGFEVLLEEEDTSLQLWLMGQQTPPDVYGALLAEIAAFRDRAP